MKVLQFKMYSGFIVGFICILIGAYLIVASTNKPVRDFFFLAGILSEAYSLLILIMIKRYKTN